MNYFDAILLGILQGLTEFLPVSSSGHLVLAEALLGAKQPGVSFEVMVHLGTLLSVLVYFRSSIVRLLGSLLDRRRTEDHRMIAYLIVGTIPAGLVGVLLKDFFERTFSNPALAAAMLLFTGVLLLLTRFVRKREGEFTAAKAFLVGWGQALAILPGISRSGSTIAVALFAGIRPARAAEFAFLLSIPTILGAAVLQAGELSAMTSAMLWPVVTGAVCAFVTGLAAVYVVMTTIRNGTFDYFAYYCFAAGAVGLYLFL